MPDSSHPSNPRRNFKQAQAGELRWNALTDRWVVIAPARASRPAEAGGAHPAPEPETRIEPVPGCPFCPGSEDKLPGILWEAPSPESPGWRVRSVPNRYPAFAEAAEGPTATGAGGGSPGPGPERVRLLAGSPGFTVPARGRQEVVIESPSHWTDLSTMAPERLLTVIEAYRVRYTALAAWPGAARVILFRNQGRQAGTSLRHPHAQLFALAFDPPEIAAREAVFRRLRGELGGACPLCRIESVEPDVEARLIHRDGGFSCWVPWAAESPFEVWIAPRRHAPDIRDLSAEESDTLARLLGRVARAFGETAGDPDYNLLLHSASPRDPAAAELHWWIRFRPRMGQAAGLELLSGVGINPSSPDEDAASLRRAMGKDDGRPPEPGNRNTSAPEA